MNRGRLEHFVQSCLAYAACRIVYDSAKRLLVIHINSKTEICNNILYFLALIEGHSSIYSVWNGRLAQDLFKGSALCIGAVEHGHLAVWYLLVVAEFADTLHYSRGFIYVAVCLYNAYRLAQLLAGKHFLVNLPAVMADKGIGGRNNGLGGTVVLFKFE